MIKICVRKVDCAGIALISSIKLSDQFQGKKRRNQGIKQCYGQLKPTTSTTVCYRV